jgi:outer membrane immunogenic protein
LRREVDLKKLVLAVSVLALCSASAVAADLSPRMYSKAPAIVDPGYDWSGFYVGGNVGYSWGRARTSGDLSGTQNVSVFRTAGPTLISSVTSPLAAASLSGRNDMDGFIGGGQVGYNWHRSQWLFGLEADLQGSDQRASGDVCTLAGCPIGSTFFTANYKLDWFGTLRGRVGFLPTDRILLYATGGLAYGHFAADAPALPLSWGSTRAGWTVGAGTEVAIDRNWSVKLEYLYMDLGNVGGGSSSATTVTNAPNTPGLAFNTVTTTTLASTFHSRFTDNIVRVGVNYRWGGPAVGRY